MYSERMGEVVEVYVVRVPPPDAPVHRVTVATAPRENDLNMEKQCRDRAERSGGRRRFSGRLRERPWLFRGSRRLCKRRRGEPSHCIRKNRESPVADATTKCPERGSGDRVRPAALAGASIFSAEDQAPALRRARAMQRHFYGIYRSEQKGMASRSHAPLFDRRHHVS